MNRYLLLALCLIGCGDRQQDSLGRAERRLETLERRQSDILSSCDGRLGVTLAEDLDALSSLRRDLAELGRPTDADAVAHILANAGPLEEELASLPEALDRSQRALESPVPAPLALPGHLAIQAPDECVSGSSRVLWRWMLAAEQSCEGALGEAADRFRSSRRVPADCAGRTTEPFALDDWRALQRWRPPGPAHVARARLALARQRLSLLRAGGPPEPSDDRLTRIHQLLDEAESCLASEGNPIPRASRACDPGEWLEPYVVALVSARLAVAAVIAVAHGCDDVNGSADDTSGLRVRCTDEDDGIRLRGAFDRALAPATEELRTLDIHAGNVR